jgi:2-polyprenyl-6-methoxyphenol hydroxylase-like FAD-dependent oxidoreductase
MSVPPVIRHAVGNGSYMVHFPNGSEKCGIYVAVKAKAGTINNDTDVQTLLKSTFASYSPEFKDCIDKMHQSSEQYDTDLVKLESNDWYKGRVVLIGDAQHAMSQLIGQGAAMALEDANVLADELAKGETIDASLAAFARRRQKRVLGMQRLSNRLMNILLVDGNIKTALRDGLLKVIPKNLILNLVERELKKSV